MSRIFGYIFTGTNCPYTHPCNRTCTSCTCINPCINTVVQHPFWWFNGPCCQATEHVIHHLCFCCFSWFIPLYILIAAMFIVYTYILHYVNKQVCLCSLRLCAWAWVWYLCYSNFAPDVLNTYGVAVYTGKRNGYV